MKFKAIVEYEYPMDHKPPVKAEIVLHGDRVTTDIIKIIEQQPCDDTISRQAVLEWLKDKDIIKTKNQEENARKELANLPPVTPQPKIGHWIADVDRWGDIVTTVNGYRCSECNNFNTDRDKYCPNCGAKMQEPQESEE